MFYAGWVYAEVPENAFKDSDERCYCSNMLGWWWYHRKSDDDIPEKLLQLVTDYPNHKELYTHTKNKYLYTPIGLWAYCRPNMSIPKFVLDTMQTQS